MRLFQDIRARAARLLCYFAPKDHEFWRTLAALVGTLVAVLVAVAGGFWGLYQYNAQVRGERVGRTLALFDKVNAGINAELPVDEAVKWEAVHRRKAVFRYFPGRSETPVRRLPEAEAKQLLEIALAEDLKNDEDRKRYEKYDVARRHLNELEGLAFAFVYDYASRELIAAAQCARLVRSNRYFEELFKAFRDKLGLGQSWQIIPYAVKLMEQDYGSGCDRLYAKLAG
jgi:hypothetical protein